ncbi:Aste57867_25100 [Aphanomyces stellatus]|uniref:Aste57867_25100 protein n=1 Tax=Aphanomyces stellatus TaxID=120398 RepID=A0A485LUD3_9STRA|nr:hypothetical protein As57867_025022 [Aphanomyces stellatus]VFU01731.1 Aste57867_25100 [Aphanomyces stellatus]
MKLGRTSSLSAVWNLMVAAASLLAHLARIVEFQPDDEDTSSLPGHLVPFLRFRATPPPDAATGVDATHAILVALDRVLAPWLATYRLAHLDLLCHRLPFVVPLVAHHAAFTGAIETLDYLDVHVCALEPMLLVSAAIGNAVAVIDWLDEGFGEEDEAARATAIGAALDAAATLGHFVASTTKDDDDDKPVDAMRRLHAMLVRDATGGCSTAAMDGAAANGHLATVQFLHTHRTEGCSDVAMRMAAANGHLDTALFLAHHRDEGCVVDALNDAVAAGYPDARMYLGGQDCGCGRCGKNKRRRLEVASPTRRSQVAPAGEAPRSRHFE